LIDRAVDELEIGGAEIIMCLDRDGSVERQAISTSASAIIW
jgi:hypothetical protein